MNQSLSFSLSPFERLHTAVVIPAYNPLPNLPQILLQLALENITPVVVNDGSTSFPELYRSDNDFLNSSLVVLHHHTNRGKGAALKTGFVYIKYSLPHIRCIATMDADGQHKVDDLLCVVQKCWQSPHSLILGVRTAEEKPFISSLGNALVQKALQCLSGKPLTDTQTGLRAFDKSLLDLHLKTPGKKFEYETNALMVCIRKNIAIAETPITTIYHDRNNSCSHFRRIKDSVRIGMGIALFASSSFLCFLIDYFLYALGVTLLPPGTYSLVLAIVFARIASSAVNYFLNYTFVFSSDRPHLQTAPAYFALVTFIMICNCAITVSLTHLAGINPFIAKIIAECSLFILSFTIQHLKIFSTPHNKKVNLS